MTLRELKRSGGFLLPDSRGAWNHYHDGEKAKCPYPDCYRTWIVVSGARVVSTRIPRDDGNHSVIGTIICQASACGRPFEVGVSDPKESRHLHGL